MRMLSNLNIYDKFSSKKPTLFDGWESDQWPQLMLCDVLSDWVCPPVPRWPPARPASHAGNRAPAQCKACITNFHNSIKSLSVKIA